MSRRWAIMGRALATTLVAFAGLVLGGAAGTPDSDWQRTLDAALAARGRGELAVAEKLLGDAVRDAGEGSAGDERRLQALEETGDTLAWFARRELEAVPVYEQAIALRKKRGELGEARGRKTLTALRMLYQHTQQWVKIVEVDRLVIQQLEAAPGNDPSALASELTALAWALRRLDPHSAEAEAALARATALAGGGANGADTLITTAGQYLESGQHDLAVDLLERARRLASDSPAPSLHRISHIDSLLGRAQAGAGRLDESLEAFARARAVEEDRLGDSHPYLVNTLLDLAEAQLATKRFGDARATFEQAATIRRAGGEKPTARMRSGLTRAAHGLGEDPEAAAVGKDCECTCSTLLATDLDALRNAGRVQEARATALRRVADAEKEHGAQSEQVAARLGDVVALLWNVDPAAAAAAAARRHDILQARRGVADPDVAAAAGEAAYLYATIDEASSSRFYEAKLASLQAAGRVTLQFADSLVHSAEATARQERYAEALPTFRLGLDAWRLVAGERAPEVLQTRNRIAWTLIQLKRHAEAETLLREDMVTLADRRVDSQEEELLLDRTLIGLKEVLQATDRPEEARAAERQRMGLELYRRAGA